MKRGLLKTGCIVLFTSLAFTAGVNASQRRHISEEFLRDQIHPGLQRSCRQLPQRNEAQQALQEFEHQQTKMEVQQARKVIDGVISMYSYDVNFDRYIRSYNVDTGRIVREVNASYTHDSRTFEFPRILRNAREIIYTAIDQGIVSHEAGHMVLHFLRNFPFETSHIGAFHEAFADLTSHFYRFYNPQTRQGFLARLERGQGCVGDTDFTCTRNSSQSLTLGHVAQDEELCEPHKFSKTFSSAIYLSMVSAYANRNKQLSTDEQFAGTVVTWHRCTLVSAVLSLKDPNPTLMDIAQKMLEVSHPDAQYRDVLGRSFINNNLIVLMYRLLPTRRCPNPPIYYHPNERFSQLCLAKR